MMQIACNMVKIESTNDVEEVRESSLISRTSVVSWNSELSQTIGPLLVPASEMTDEERTARWYQSIDYNTNRRVARNIASSIRNTEDINSRSSYIGTITRVYDSTVRSCDPTEIDLRMLEHWSRVGHSRRGLEHWSVTMVATERRKRRVALIGGITQLQLDPEIQRLTDDQRADILRRYSVQASRAARVFAYIMGRADAAALYYGRNATSSIPRARSMTVV